MIKVNKDYLTKKSYEYIIKNTGTSSTTRTVVTFRTIIIYELLIISSTSDAHIDVIILLGTLVTFGTYGTYVLLTILSTFYIE